MEDRFYPLGCREANHGIAPLRVSLNVKMVGHHFLRRGCEWSNRARRRIGVLDCCYCLGAHLPHDPLFLDLGGEGCPQLWLEMCHNYSLPHGSRVSIIIPKGGGSFAPGLCVISRGR